MVGVACRSSQGYPLATGHLQHAMAEETLARLFSPQGNSATYLTSRRAYPVEVVQQRRIRQLDSLLRK